MAPLVIWACRRPRSYPTDRSTSDSSGMRGMKNSKISATEVPTEATEVAATEVAAAPIAAAGIAAAPVASAQAAPTPAAEHRAEQQPLEQPAAEAVVATRPGREPSRGGPVRRRAAVDHDFAADRLEPVADALGVGGAHGHGTWRAALGRP